jgi:hypothetical protein
MSCFDYEDLSDDEIESEVSLALHPSEVILSDFQGRDCAEFGF